MFEIHLLSAAVIIACTVYIYYKWSFSYWKVKGVPCIEPIIPVGNVLALFSEDRYVGEHLKMGYDMFRNLGHVHGGSYLFSSPRYMPIDVKVIKSILREDFNSFTERGFYYNEKDDPLSANLFSLGGERWRNLRSKLSPAFTSAKLKVIFDSLMVCASKLDDAICEIEATSGLIDVELLSTNFSITVIALCAFGIDCDCFKNPNSEFVKFGLKTFDYTSWWRRIKAVFSFAMPNLALKLGIEVFGKDHTRFFTTIVKETIEFREKTNMRRKDLIQLLIDLKNNTSSDVSKEEVEQWQKGATIEELAAQVFIFFAAGFETTSTTFCFCLYELAINLEIQNRVRTEIITVLREHNGIITYESISNMKYTNQVLEETLRKYPPVSFIGRKCERPYRVPDTNVTLDRGTYIDISILGVHHDPEYYPDPEKFDPERFSDAAKKSRAAFTYLPFGEGPRICIGQRFAIMQLKVALAVLLRRYEISLNEQTITPIQFKTYSFTLNPKNKIFVNIREHRN